MSTKPPVNVTLDDRIRLISALLAATNFPQTSQDRKRHHAHAHARATMKYMHDKNLASHPAVLALQGLLDQGAPLEALYTLVMHLEWPGLKIASLPRWVPPKWNLHLWDFYQKADLASYFANARIAWENAQAQAGKIFADVKFREFLSIFLGDIQEEFVFVPNICYPADSEIGIRVGNQLIAITPPPLAWGDSPPWPYDEETMATHSYRAALSEYGRLLLVPYLRTHAEQVADAAKRELPISEQLRAIHPTWEDQLITLFLAGAVAIYLEDYVNEAEAKAYILMEKKARGMTILPGTISVLRRYMQEQGSKYETLVDFLPVMPAQLRVAKKIVTM